MRRVVCWMRGHRWVMAESRGLMVMPEAGLTLRWRRAPRGTVGDGSGCIRCGRFSPHGGTPWTSRAAEDS